MPGAPKSRLITAVQHSDPSFKMPPKAKLSADESLRCGLGVGAPWIAVAMPRSLRRGLHRQRRRLGGPLSAAAHVVELAAPGESCAARRVGWVVAAQ